MWRRDDSPGQYHRRSPPPRGSGSGRSSANHRDERDRPDYDRERDREWYRGHPTGHHPHHPRGEFEPQQRSSSPQRRAWNNERPHPSGYHRDSRDRDNNDPHRRYDTQGPRWTPDSRPEDRRHAPGSPGTGRVQNPASHRRPSPPRRSWTNPEYGASSRGGFSDRRIPGPGPVPGGARDDRGPSERDGSWTTGAMRPVERRDQPRYPASAGAQPVPRRDQPRYPGSGGPPPVAARGPGMGGPARGGYHPPGADDHRGMSGRDGGFDQSNHPHPHHHPGHQPHHAQGSHSGHYQDGRHGQGGQAPHHQQQPHDPLDPISAALTTVRDPVIRKRLTGASKYLDARKALDKARAQFRRTAFSAHMASMKADFALSKAELITARRILLDNQSASQLWNNCLKPVVVEANKEPSAEEASTTAAAAAPTATNQGSN